MHSWELPQTDLVYFHPILEYDQGRIDPTTNKSILADNLNASLVLNSVVGFDKWPRAKPDSFDAKRDVPAINNAPREVEKGGSRPMSLKERFKGQFVVSKSPLEVDSARYLCESPQVSGMDWVNLQEGQYCDMDKKQHWPLCEENGLTSNCFHLERQALLGDIPATVGDQNVPGPFLNLAVQVPDVVKQLNYRKDLK
jgi:hypothetical protein